MSRLVVRWTLLFRLHCGRASLSESGMLCETPVSASVPPLFPESTVTMVKRIQQLQVSQRKFACLLGYRSHSKFHGITAFL